MLVSAAAIVAPMLTDLSGLVPEARAAEEAKTDKKDNIGYIKPECNGCQVCTIFFSVCLAVNNRVCWCDTKGFDRSAAQRG
jgi:hypothetical protein